MLQGCLVHQQAVVSCRYLLTSVVAVAADVTEGWWQDTEGQAGEATQEQREVERLSSEAAGDLPGVTSRAKAAVGETLLRNSQPLWQ